MNINQRGNGSHYHLVKKWALGCSSSLVLALMLPTAAIAQQDGSAATTETADNETDDNLIVVSASRIEGVSPASAVTVVSAEEIELRGISSVEEVLRYVPQNFSTIGAGSNADASGVAFVDGAVTANLRGLGEGATLVLVNGKRIASSPASGGTFTDISTIPFGAIERVEIVSDGASAIYGSDAVGGVINFILKKDYSGAQSHVRYENSSNGGHAYVADQTLGFNWGSGNITANVQWRKEDPVNRFDAGLTDISDFTAQGGRAFAPRGSRFGQAGQSPFRDAAYSLDLTPDNEQVSAYLNLTQNITDKLTLGLSGQYAKRDSSARATAHGLRVFVPGTNFYGGGVSRYGFFAETDRGDIDRPISITESERYSINGSLDWSLPIRDWEFSAGFGFSADQINNMDTLIDTRNDPAAAAALASSDPNVALNLFGDGSMQRPDLNSLVSFRDQGTRTGKQQTFNVNLNGSLVSLPGGDLKFSVGGELRDDTLDLTNFRLNPIGRSDPSLVSFEPKAQNQAVFGELFIPLISGQKFFQELSVQLAGRYDNYDLNGPFDGFDTNGMILPFTTRSFSAFTPKVGVVWRPADDLRIRATWGEAFQIPTLPELFEPRFLDTVFPDSVFDPLNPASNGGPGFVDFPFVAGGNPNLQPQKSKTWSFGFDLTPTGIPGFNMSMTYNRTKFTDVIGSLFDVFGVELFGNNGFPLLNADQFPDAVRRDANGVLIFYDRFGPTNLTSRKSESIDFNIRQRIETETAGRFEVGLAGSYTIKLENTFGPGVAPVELQGTDVGPPEWNLKASIDWSLDDFSASAVVNHTSGYENSDPAALLHRIDGYTTVDASIRYTLGTSGWRFGVGVNNLFDADFPFIDNRNGVNSSRVDFRGRVFFLDLKKEFSF